MKPTPFCIVLSLFCYLTKNIAQQNTFKPAASPEIHIKKTTTKITLDGKLDEIDWQKAEQSSPFWESIPYDTSLAITKTEVRLTFDNNNLYVGAKCYQKKSSYIVQSLRRDFPPGTTDLFGLIFDPFCDKQNGFSFVSSPFGVQREGLIANGNEFSTDWDNKWFVEVQNEPEFYTVEIAIPFKTLRYKTIDGETNVWFANFFRYDQSRTQAERSNWAPLPRFSSGNNVAFTGKLIWDDAPPKPSGSNISFIPYVLGATSKDFVAETKPNTEGGIGFDAKVAITSSLNLDLTANPDFAQVEVDRQQTNLSRFELFYPERRQFFLENSDLFGSFGFENVNPLFSRRIGLASDSVGNAVKVPILVGARLTGKLDKNWRIGVLDMQTDGRKDLKINASNFFATAVQRKVFSRSTVNFLFLNKQDFESDANGKNTWSINSNAFNRIVGVDYNLASKDGLWQGKAFVHRSLTPTPQYQPFAAAAAIEYNNTNFNFSSSLESVGSGYAGNVTGYVPRNNYYRSEPNVNFVFYPKSQRINSVSLGMDGDVFWRLSDNRLTDYDFSPLAFDLVFQNNSGLSLVPIRWDYTYLFEPFDPTNTGGKELPQGTTYTYRSTRWAYASNSRRLFSVKIQGRFGQYFNGKINAVSASFTYRWQPYGLFSLDVNYNKINLPTGYNDRQLLLIGPRFDFSFTRSVFFTTFLQYNNQINNVNLNARFQWRFAPVSDLFLVYTQNYFAEDDTLAGYRSFDAKNRALVLKCTYWLNL
ncbi:MAG: carbohydrate binding family 9 domain-containing protein [Saprospiraceae bacterium]|nr:carbohydrate binding family 9 domain-containing protein [Saprospiraceae bacterium]